MEARIREIAYQKWEAAGCPFTTEDERNRFWYEAEQEVLKPIQQWSNSETVCVEDQTVFIENRRSEEVVLVNRWNIPGINIK